MNKRTFLIVAITCSLFAAHGQAFSPITYTPAIKEIDINADKCPTQLFISPTGNDGWSGMKVTASGNDGPFATLERAKEEVKKQKHKNLPKGGIAINLLGGVYPLVKSFELSADDGGTEGSPIVYKAWKDEEVSLIGGKKLTSKDISAVANPKILARINPIAKGNVYQFDTKALGINHKDVFPDMFSDGGGIFELFFNGKRLPLSRWPDEGNTTMKEVVNPGEKNIPGTFIYQDSTPVQNWQGNNNIWLKGFWRVGWENPAIKVASIDTTTHQITFKVGLQAGIGSKYKRPKGSGKEEWYAINLLEEITKPGEWCMDFNTGIVYFWPPAPIDQADIMVSQMDQPIISANNVANVAFIGLTLEASLGDGMVFTKSNQNLVAGCTFRNLGGRGVVLDGIKSGIQSCDMYGLGRGCIVISGGNKEKLIESGNYVINNHLHDYGALKSQYSAAVDLYSDNKNLDAVGIYVGHNLIHHAPRDGVLFAGQKNVFEYNEIHRCSYATADVGAFYSWLDWTIRGVVIRYNYIHNTVGGVNPDDGSSGTFVYGNIFAGNRTGIWIASGPDHSIINNIFIKNDGPVFGMDERGKGRGYATNKKLLSGVDAIHASSPPWSIEFPEMPTLLSSHPELPIRTKFIGNVVWIKKGEPVLIKLGKENKADTGIIRMEGNFVTDKDPGFIDANSGNLNVKPNAPIYEKIPSFPKIKFDKMGLYIDKYRKKLPTAEEAGRLPSQNPWKDGDTDNYFGT
ncbi:right-handed parallel beta-helix repeat-containing protein [Parasediminibacterium sp. JCM 36343]|uniref:right-handed parallel beta-helix repeat-containing protein n=1 Tax=Parasediminibacterium sp. JCM 36343 TaxID=3374279 RepID=UPI00397E73DD